MSVLFLLWVLDPRFKTGSETSMPLVSMAVEAVPAQKHAVYVL